MTRVDLCASDDHDTKDLLLTVIHEVGGTSEAEDWHEAGLGVGLHRFRVGADELTVFVDAWGVDLAGPEPLVRRVLVAMAMGPDEPRTNGD